MTRSRPVGPARYEEAFGILGLGHSASVRDIKRAYRAAVAAHPPDRDPKAFERIREAYELLSTPETALGVLLEARTHVPAPSFRPPPPIDLRRALPLSTLRAIVAELDAAALLGEDDGR